MVEPTAAGSSWTKKPGMVCVSVRLAVIAAGQGRTHGVSRRHVKSDMECVVGGTLLAVTSRVYIQFVAGLSTAVQFLCQCEA